MRFTAEHLSYQEIDEVWTFALGNKGDNHPDEWVILTFGDEGEQDAMQGLTGLYLETSTEVQGYGLVERLFLQDNVLSIELDDDLESIVVTIPARHSATAKVASVSCNSANATRPRRSQ